MDQLSLTEILPEKGLVYSELKELQPVLCRPKLLPIKSYSLERLERLEKKAVLEAKQRREAERAERGVAAWNTAPTAQQKRQQQQQESVQDRTSPKHTPAAASAPSLEDAESFTEEAPRDPEEDP